MLNSKQAKAKLIISILVFVFIIGSLGLIFTRATSEPVHTPYVPADNSWQTLSVNFSSLCVVNQTSYNVSHYIMDGNGWTKNGSYDRANNTYWSNVTNFNESNYTGVIWNAICFVNQTEGLLGNGTWLKTDGNLTIFLDGITPKIGAIYPANGTWWNNQTDIVISVIANDTNIDNCKLYHNISFPGAYALNETIDMTNATRGFFTPIPISPLMQTNVSYYYDIVCTDNSGNSNASANYSLYIDYTAPSIAIPSGGNYSNNFWVNSYVTQCDKTNAGKGCNISFESIVSDYSPETCELFHNINGSFGWNQTNGTGILNGSVYSWPAFGSVAENASGYSWNVRCNDTAGNIGWMDSTQNFTLKIDTIKPTRTNFTWPANGTYTSDLSPLINWTNASDLNFNSYILQVANSTTNDSSIIQNMWYSVELGTAQTLNFSYNDLDVSNVTNNGSLYDAIFYYRINTTDDAGNYNMSTPWQLRIKHSCSILEAGEYSYCAMIRSYQANATMEQIGRETNADFVYKYELNHSWTTHTVGSSINAYYNLSRDTSDVVVIHIASSSGNQYWNGTRVWDLANISHPGNQTFNFTNNSESNWNLVPWINLSSPTFHDIYMSLNNTGVGTINQTGPGNFTFFSYPNANISGDNNKYMAYVWFRGAPWNRTVIESGTAFWAAYEGPQETSAVWNLSLTRATFT